MCKSKELDLFVLTCLVTLLITILPSLVSFFSIVTHNTWLLHVIACHLSVRTKISKEDIGDIFFRDVLTISHNLHFSGNKKWWKRKMTGPPVLSCIWFETRVNSMKYIHTVNFGKCEISVLHNRNSLPMERFKNQGKWLRKTAWEYNRLVKQGKPWLKPQSTI